MQTVPDLSFCGGKGPVSKTAARPTDNECSSVGRTQLSDTGVGDELTVVVQVTRGATDLWQIYGITPEGRKIFITRTRMLLK